MSRRSLVAISILSLTILALLAFQTPLMAGMRRLTWNMAVKITGKIAGVGLLHADDDVLSQLSKLQIENIRLKAERQDYQRLRAQLGSLALENMTAVPALVAMRPLDSFRSELMLNKGSADGVSIQAPVVIQGSVLIGFIADTSEHSSVCRLLLSPMVSLPAEVVNENHSRGLVRGENYTGLRLTTVPRDAELKQGQSVATSADDQTPAGLLIGTLNVIKNDQNEAYQNATLSIPYDTDDLRAVNILVAP